ncbi:MAG: hypothetical protein AAGB24_10780 [Bacteroidota bacterium]
MFLGPLGLAIAALSFAYYQAQKRNLKGKDTLKKTIDYLRKEQARLQRELQDLRQQQGQQQNTGQGVQQAPVRTPAQGPTATAGQGPTATAGQGPTATAAQRSTTTAGQGPTATAAQRSTVPPAPPVGQTPPAPAQAPPAQRPAPPAPPVGQTRATAAQRSTVPPAPPVGQTPPAPAQAPPAQRPVPPAPPVGQTRPIGPATTLDEDAVIPSPQEQWDNATNNSERPAAMETTNQGPDPDGAGEAVPVADSTVSNGLPDLDQDVDNLMQSMVGPSSTPDTPAHSASHVQDQQRTFPVPTDPTGSNGPGLPDLDQDVDNLMRSMVRPSSTPDTPAHSASHVQDQQRTFPVPTDPTVSNGLSNLDGDVDNLKKLMTPQATLEAAKQGYVAGRTKIQRATHRRSQSATVATAPIRPSVRTP